jgi:hypothetical protein
MALPHAFQPWLFDAEQVEVYKFDGSLQCNPDAKPAPPEAVRTELEAAGIAVRAVRKDHVGLVPQVCGFPTGQVNVAVIAPDQYAAALALGYTYFATQVSSSGDPALAAGFENVLDLSNLRFTRSGMPGPGGDPEGPLPWPRPRPRTPLDPGAGLPGLPKPGVPLPFPPFPGGSGHAHKLIAELPGHVCRIIRPGDMITMDLRRERFNITLDEHDAIVSVGFF